MNYDFTLNDIETFLDCRFKITWVRRTLYNYKIGGYKQAELSDLDHEKVMLKLRRKGKDYYQDMYIDNEKFIFFSDDLFRFGKDVSNDWVKFKNNTLEMNK